MCIIYSPSIYLSLVSLFYSSSIDIYNWQIRFISLYFLIIGHNGHIQCHELPCFVWLMPISSRIYYIYIFIRYAIACFMLCLLVLWCMVCWFVVACLHVMYHSLSMWNYACCFIYPIHLTLCSDVSA